MRESPAPGFKYEPSVPARPSIEQSKATMHGHKVGRCRLNR